MALKLGVNNVSNEDYHADKEYVSSSNLKLLLKDPAAFYDQKILGNSVSFGNQGAFDEGTYTHTLILEPHMVEEEVAIFPGMRKAGPAFKTFKSSNAGKLIISKPQDLRCQEYFKAYKRRPEAVELIRNGKAEHTICAVLAGVRVKIRADWINPEEGYIADVKTTAFPADLESFKLTMKDLNYGLSGALYSTVAEQFYGKPFDFKYIVIDKKNMVCEVFNTSERTMQKGRADVLKALSIYRDCIKSGKWESNPTEKLFGKKKKVESNYRILEV